MTDIDERAVLVHAEQQGAEILARFPRLGPAANDKFLFVDDFEFAPVWRALPGDVSRCRQLRDEPLPAVRECAVVQRPPISFGDLAQPEDRRSRTSEHLLESLAAFNERPAAEVDGTSLQEVECDECHTSVRLSSVSVCEVDAALKILEACRLSLRV